MLKKLLVLLILVGFVVSAASYMTGFITFYPEVESLEFVPEEAVVTMSILTDTEVYHSGEYMEAMVTTACNQDLGSVIIRFYGIMDRFGNYKINQEEIVEIKAPGNETVFSASMPRCYGCAGVNPGDYNLTAELIYDGETLETVSKTITLAN